MNAPAKALTALLALSALPGCTLNIEPPSAVVEDQYGAWQVQRKGWGPRVNESLDWYRQASMPGVRVGCGIRARDPENTVEVDLYSDGDREIAVRVACKGPEEATVVTGSYRRVDESMKWTPDRRFRAFESGGVLVVPAHGAVTLTFPSAVVFGHFPPEAEDRLVIRCAAEEGDRFRAVDGDFRILEVRRRKTTSFGH